MLEKIKKFNLFLRRRPILLAVIFIVLVVLILPWGKSTKKQPEVAPETHLRPLNPNLKPETTFDQLATEQPIQKIDVFQIAPPSPEQLNTFFNPIVKEFNFSAPAQKIDINKIPRLYWRNPPNFLTVNLQTGSFTLDYHPETTAAVANLAAIDAGNIAKNWLLKYRLIDDRVNFQASIIEDKIGDAYENSGNPNFQVYFSPTLNSLPVFAPNSVNEPISIIVTPQGHIYSVYYQFPPVLFTDFKSIQADSRAVLSSKQIEQAIKDKRPTISRLTFPDGQFAPSTTPVKTVNYNKVALGYSNEITDGQLLPLFQLTGSGKLPDGTEVQVTAYLPALSE